MPIYLFFDTLFSWASWPAVGIANQAPYGSTNPCIHHVSMHPKMLVFVQYQGTTYKGEHRARASSMTSQVRWQSIPNLRRDPEGFRNPTLGLTHVESQWMFLQRFYGFTKRISSFNESWSAKWPSCLGFWLEFAQYGAEGYESARRAFVAARQNLPSITSQSHWKLNKKIGKNKSWTPKPLKLFIFVNLCTFAQSSALCFEAWTLPVAPKHSRRHH